MIIDFNECDLCKIEVEKLRDFAEEGKKVKLSFTKDEKGEFSHIKVEQIVKKFSKKGIVEAVK